MNELQVFKSPEFGQVRVIQKNGDPWFVAKDVCEVLEIDVTQTRRLTDKMKGLHSIQTPGGEQQMTVINEAGVYKLVFTSRKPEAEKFTDWIAGEVLPSIRKTGGYVASEELFIQTYLPFADDHTKAMFKSTLEVVKKQNEVIQIMKPKADYFDDLVERNLLTNFRDTAKELKVGQNAFIDWLLEKRYVYRDARGKLKPIADYTPSLFELKEFTRNGKADNQTLITPKGRETFRLLLIRDGKIKKAV
ncbi:Phage antirepressor protein KilAC domain-containing protein [Geosporobacter subterraneus DSM 17957]|uniref:Phage antirepressor protein KilAC domain-containing protein n=1 Tax=Geosporobacter subterraneus DSM 17957 TaxID=1121919 RepID=A0A1M6DT05_9FIRM|nr:phage antirepressor KilAC domain-containing protein [Geosporobacter subterraneus]SHI76387.1 Phage antirepressor protein KilAC domain-containing protein [Geosporobacter subterraneus DSM 17957]